MKHMLILVLAALLTCQIAVGQRNPGRRGLDSGDLWEFYSKKYDKDKDGKITSEEYTRSQVSFERLDRNGDSALTKDDFSGGNASRRRGNGRRPENNQSGTVMFRQLATTSIDKDKNSIVSSAEWTEFKTVIDKDKNGSISVVELQAAGVLSESIAELIQEFDADKDQEVTVEEIEALFKKTDINTSGTLEEAELKADARPARRNRRGNGGRPGQGRTRGGMPQMMFKRLLSMSADTNDNGAIEADEWASFKKTLDADQNGEIDESEFTNSGAPQRMAGMLFGRMDVDEDGKVTAKDLDSTFSQIDTDKSGALEAGELTGNRRNGGRTRRMGRGDRSARGPTLEKGVPAPGEQAPDFELAMLGEGKGTLKLSSFVGKKPVALIFGSYT